MYQIHFGPLQDLTLFLVGMGTPVVLYIFPGWLMPSLQHRFFRDSVFGGVLFFAN